MLALEEVSASIRDLVAVQDELSSRIRRWAQSRSARSYRLETPIDSTLGHLLYLRNELSRQADEVGAMISLPLDMEEPPSSRRDARGARRIVEVSIWAATEERSAFDQVVDATKSLLEQAGFDVVPQAAAQQASWFQGLKAKAREAVSNEEVAGRLADIEDALRAQQLDVPQSQVTLVLAQAASSTIESLKGVHEAVIVIGNLLLVKTMDDGAERIVTYTMTAEELRHFKRGDYVKDPLSALDWLHRGASDAPGRFEVSANPDSAGTMDEDA